MDPRQLWGFRPSGREHPIIGIDTNDVVRTRCEFDRDSGWEVLGQAGFEPVRMIAIDADWSALRFRRVEYILSLTRDPARAGSPAGKLRTAPK